MSSSSETGTIDLNLKNVAININGKPVDSVSVVSSAQGSDVYEVEKIVNHRTDDFGRVQYFIKWKGYSSNDNTWESEKNIIDKDLINTYNEERKKTKAPKKRRRERDRNHAADRKEQKPSTLSAKKCHGEGQIKPKKKYDGDTKTCTKGTTKGDYGDVKIKQEKTEVEMPKETAEVKEADSNSKQGISIASTGTVNNAALSRASGGLKDVGLDEMFKQAKTSRKNGFEKNYKVDYIVGMTREEIGPLQFLVKWVKDDLVEGDEEVELLPIELVKEKAPIPVCLYYESLITKIYPAYDETYPDSGESEY